MADYVFDDVKPWVRATLPSGVNCSVGSFELADRVGKEIWGSSSKEPGNRIGACEGCISTFQFLWTKEDDPKKVNQALTNLMQSCPGIEITQESNPFLFE